MSNTNFLDQTVRIFAAITIGAAFGAFMSPIAFIAPYFLITGLVGYDPFYHYYKYYTTEENPYENHSKETGPLRVPEPKVKPHHA